MALVVFDGVQGLDVFGPADVFYFANYYAEQSGERAGRRTTSSWSAHERAIWSWKPVRSGLTSYRATAPAA